MIAPIEGLPDNVIGFEAEGRVTREDYERVMIPVVEKAIREHGKVRCLYVLGPEFERYTMGSLWQDAKVGVEHLRSWERIACVSDADWMGHAVHAFGWMFPGAIRHFSLDEIDAAKEWVAA